LQFLGSNAKPVTVTAAQFDEANTRKRGKYTLFQDVAEIMALSTCGGMVTSTHNVNKQLMLEYGLCETCGRIGME